MSTKIVVTGAKGLIGWHAVARLHAQNCGARFRGEPEPFEIVEAGRAIFDDDDTLEAALTNATSILHFAGINRATGEMTDADVEAGNPALAERLAQAIEKTGSKAALVYANSTHSMNENPYGRGKKEAARILSQQAVRSGTPFVDMVLPHIFGEQGRPFYNNVTGTLCQQIVDGVEPNINPDGKVDLLYAGEAAQTAIDLSLAGKNERVTFEGMKLGIPTLYEKLKSYHETYTGFVFPDELRNPFDLALFNTYRQHLYPDYFPHSTKVHTDQRGRLFEVAKGGGGGQSFISWTEPGVTRGEHFHLHKVERFLVVEGKARIAMRKVLSDEMHVFDVHGDEPTYVDMPTLWTHNITNTGERPLVTMFWTHDIFDPATPDTYADKVVI